MLWKINKIGNPETFLTAGGHITNSPINKKQIDRSKHHKHVDKTYRQYLEQTNTLSLELKEELNEKQGIKRLQH